MWLQGIWDQEDMWGAIHSYLAVEPKDRDNNMNYLVMGPWRHSGVNYDGSSLGPLKWDGDTALQFRRDVLKPFFDQYLKNGAPNANTPPVFIYNTGENHWDRFKSWPLACDSGCPNKMKPLYLSSGSSLSFSVPTEAPENGFDEYVSDPEKPVPFYPRPIRFADDDSWRRWLVMDQRSAADRPDVLVYTTPPLIEPLRISGTPVVNLVASTSGTDSDWVVKLIDVFPDAVSSSPEMSGYQLAIGMDIFRGRYRESFTTPKALTPNAPLTYKFILPTANHVFLPGHRVMVQIQSSWFPLYDRNPQTFVPKIFGPSRTITRRRHNACTTPKAKPASSPCPSFRLISRARRARQFFSSSPFRLSRMLLGHLLGRQVLSTLAHMFDLSKVSIHSIRFPYILYSAPALQTHSPVPLTPSFIWLFQCFQQFRGIYFSLEVSPEGAIT
jgi:putative CocE/NonD family hydrolase